MKENCSGNESIRNRVPQLKRFKGFEGGDSRWCDPICFWRSGVMPEDGGTLFNISVEKW